ncbi:MAG: RNA polymerase sigma factor, partial [Candidatus Methylomirabilales bacterium]
MTTPEPEFERLVLEHLGGLYNLARWLTRNMDEAQDLVQETALKALKARDQF